MSKRAWNFKDLTGQVFERLIVSHLDHIDKLGQSFWSCICNCGNTITVMSGSLKKGNTKSCGCLRQETQLKQHFIHGLSESRIFSIWTNIMTRCYNKNNPSYPYYGGRGITVCSEWHIFNNFYADEGQAYKDHVAEFGEKNTTADRFPSVNGNYEKSNFRWATMSEQARGKRNCANSQDYDQHLKWKSKINILLSDILSGRRKNSALLEKYLGCSIFQFRQYIESLWLPGMSWSNRGINKIGANVWQLDHQNELYKFDLSKEEDRLKAFNFKNYQPLWWLDNSKKSKVSNLIPA